MIEERPEAPDLGQTLGMGGEELRARLGTPSTERSTGDADWVVYDSAGWRLRVRLAPQAGSSSPATRVPTVRSWTYEPATPFATLKELLSSVGLRPVGPIDSPGESGGRLQRAEIAGESVAASATAIVGDGGLVALTVFDEPPDWVRQ